MGLGFTFPSRLASFQAESSSLSYGLIVHLLLLPTPPHGDAVAVGYRPERAYLKRTSTSLTKRAFRRTEGRGAPRPCWRLTVADARQRVPTKPSGLMNFFRDFGNDARQASWSKTAQTACLRRPEVSITR